MLKFPMRNFLINSIITTKNFVSIIILFTLINIRVLTLVFLDGKDTDRVALSSVLEEETSKKRKLDSIGDLRCASFGELEKKLKLKKSNQSDVDSILSGFTFIGLSTLVTNNNNSNNKKIWM